MAWSEERLHRWIQRSGSPQPALVQGGAGNDAAVLRRGRGSTVVCCDQTLEGVHYEPGTTGARVGRKATDRVLSDLAASAARPRAVLLALSAPSTAQERWMRAVIRAVRERARAFGAELVGGDLACGPGPAGLALTGLGELAPGARAVGRQRARVGDWLAVTGPCGGSSLGRHLRIEPRLREGAWLAANGVRAMMDVSDGLVLDLERLGRASGVGFDLESVPVHRDARRLARRTGRSPEEHALTDGEDHELLVCVPARRRAGIERGQARHVPGLLFIGRVRDGAGVRIRRAEEWVRWRGKGGWLHGG